MTFQHKKTIVFHTHQGFGDLIVCSPIANYLSETNPDMNIILVTRTASQAKNLRRFCVSKVDVVNIDEYPKQHLSNGQDEIDFINKWTEEHGYGLIRSGFNSYQYDTDLPWDYSFYESIGVDYEVKSTHFFIDRNFEREKQILENLSIPKHTDYAFVHDDPSRGLNITPYTAIKTVRNFENYEIADIVCILENAAELHLMGSSILCLADMLLLPHNRQKGFYYTFRGDLTLRGGEKWQKICK